MPARGNRRPYGSGSLIEIRGAWYGQWRVGGRLVKRRIGAKRASGTREGLTRTQAEGRLRRLMEQTTHTPIQRRVDLAAAGALYLHHLEQIMHRRPTTLQDYRLMLAKHLGPYFGHTAIARIGAQQIRGYVAAKSSVGLAPKTINNHLNFLHGIFAFAVKRELAAVNPVALVDRPRPAGADPDIKFLDRSELEALLSSVRDKNFARIDQTLYLTAAVAGLRQGELLALRWQDVDFSSRVIRVRRSYTRGHWGAPKSRRGSRAVPMALRLARQLQEHRRDSHFQGESDLVFAHPQLGTVLDPSSVRVRFKRALQVAGLREVRFHDLRHTYGTLMAAAGTPLRSLQEWMGHRDHKTTLIYADYAPDPLMGARFAELAFGGKPCTQVQSTNKELAMSEEPSVRIEDPEDWEGEVANLVGHVEQLAYGDGELCDRVFASKVEAFRTGLTLGVMGSGERPPPEDVA